MTLLASHLIGCFILNVRSGTERQCNEQVEASEQVIVEAKHLEKPLQV